MEKINFQNGTLVSKAKVTIGGQIYEVEPEEYEGTTPLNADNLNKMQENAENAINEVDEKITSLNTYSTEEVKTGETWIDGKPIYKKVFKINITSTDLIAVPHNISNMSVGWVTSDSFLAVDNTFIPVNYQRYNTDNNIYAHVNMDNVLIKVAPVGWTNKVAYITIKYTKTTN